MSHDNRITFDDIFRQEDFIGSLPYIPQIRVSDQDQFVIDGVSSDMGGTIPQDTVVKLLSGFIKQRINNIDNWEEFASGWKDWLQDAGYNISSNVGLYTGFVNDIAYAMGSTIAVDNSGQPTRADQVTGDWSFLLTTPPVNPELLTFNTDPNRNPEVLIDNEQTLALMFQDFFHHYEFPNITPSSTSYPPGQADPIYFETFMDDWHTYLSATALIQNSNYSTDPDLFEGVVSYEDIYNAFGPPNATREDFNQRFKDFITEQINLGSPDAFFFPGHYIKNWMETIQAESNTDIASINTGQSSLDGNSSEKALILNRIISLLIEMITTLQEVAIEQSNRLTYETEFQNVYTALQTQVPVYLKGDGSGIDGDSEDEANARNDINSSYNGLVIDNLRSFRGIHEDNAKKIQSYVNTTNDAVNQQTDMATTFIQELNSLLTAIFY